MLVLDHLKKKKYSSFFCSFYLSWFQWEPHLEGGHCCNFLIELKWCCRCPVWNLSLLNTWPWQVKWSVLYMLLSLVGDTKLKFFYLCESIDKLFLYRCALVELYAASFPFLFIFSLILFWKCLYKRWYLNILVLFICFLGWCWGKDGDKITLHFSWKNNSFHIFLLNWISLFYFIYFYKYAYELNITIGLQIM